MNLKLALASAQALSLVVFVMIAIWYVVPWIKTQRRADALIPLLWIHAFRYVALQGFQAQKAGFPISDSGRDQILYGDLLGMALAVMAIVALRYRSRLSIPLVWILVAETILDTVANVTSGIREHLFGLATGVTWFIVSFYVPLLMVSLGLVVWQLYSRRGEPLARSISDKPAVSNAA